MSKTLAYAEKNILNFHAKLKSKGKIYCSCFKESKGEFCKESNIINFRLPRNTLILLLLECCTSHFENQNFQNSSISKCKVTI